MKQIKKEIFKNLVKATEKTFNIVELAEVENKGNDIAVYIPSKTLGFKNWNGKGNNGNVNVTLTFSSPVEEHPEDLEVEIKTHINPVNCVESFYGINIKSLNNTSFIHDLNNEINLKIDKYLQELKENNLLINKVGDSGYGYQRVKVLLDDNNSYENTFENIKYLKELVKVIEQGIEEIVDEAKLKIKAELNRRENEYQELKNLRKLARKDIVRTPEKLSRKGVISVIEKRNLTQEQLQGILEIIG